MNVRLRTRLTVLGALGALVLGACGTPAAPPPKTADDPAHGALPEPAGSSTPKAPEAPPAPSEAPPGAVPPVELDEAKTASAPEASDTITFKKKMAAVGAKYSEQRTTTMSLTLSVNAGKQPVKVVTNERSTEEKVVEILAVTTDAVTKVKVTYKDDTKIETKDGAEKTKKSVVAGKTYVVDTQGGTTTVRTPQGAAVTAEEEKEVKKDFKRLGKPDKMQNALPDGPIKVGDKLETMAQSLADYLASDDDGEGKMTVEKSKISLTSIGQNGGQRTGVFAMELDVEMVKSDLVIKMKMAGQFEVRADTGRPISMSFQAPLVVKSAAKSTGPKIGGAGLTTMSATEKSL